jgi:hypothetical protein
MIFGNDRQRLVIQHARMVVALTTSFTPIAAKPRGRERHNRGSTTVVPTVTRTDALKACRNR